MALEKNASVGRKNLDLQEQKTRIAFLENEQAELETEIRMLRGQVKISTIALFTTVHTALYKKGPKIFENNWRLGYVSVLDI